MTTTKSKCEICGKFHNSGCPYFCSMNCCETAVVNSAASLGVNEEAALQEVLNLCGEDCPN